MIKSVRFVMSVIPQNIFFNQIPMNYGTSTDTITFYLSAKSSDCTTKEQSC